MTIYKILKRLSATALGFVVLVVVAYGALIIVNLEDEALGPAAQAFAAAAARTVPDAQNGYFAAQGLYFSSAGMDPHAVGLEMFAHAATRQRKGDFRWDKNLKRYLPRPEGTDLCNESSPCLARVRADRAAIEFQLAKHETLRQRISEFVRYPQYEVPYLPYPGTFMMMQTADFHMIRTLGGTESAYLWASGRQGEAIAQVAERVAMARRILREPNEVINVLQASIWLRDEYRLLAEFTHDDPAAARKFYAQIEPLLRPPPDDEVRATRWVHGEFANALETTRAIATIPQERRIAIGYLLLPQAYSTTDGYEKNLPWWFDPAFQLLSPLYQPMATLNRLAQDYARLATAIGGGPRTVAELLSKSGAPAQRHAWSAYNPVGAVVESPDYGTYVKRLNDTFRFMRLVGLQGALVKERVPLTDINAFLASSELAVDPVTGRRIGWDAARARLHLDALDPARPTGDVAGQLSVNYRP